MTYQEIKSFINTYIVTNGVGAITAARLNTILNELADYKGFNAVVVTTLPAGSDATATVQGMTLVLGIPRGADGRDGQDGQNAINPFKGWFNSLDDLKDLFTASAGDSAYVKDASPATTWSIYVYDETATTDNNWADSGTDADTSNVQTFRTGEEVNEVGITNDLEDDDPKNILAAPQGKILKGKIFFELTSMTYDGDGGGFIPNSSNVVSYITDQYGVVIATINKDGSFTKLVKTPEEINIDEIVNLVSSNSFYNDENVLKYFLDENGCCLGYIEKDGTVVISKARIDNLENERQIANVGEMSAIIGLLANSVDNIAMSNNPKLMAMLGNVKTDTVVELNKDNDNNLNLQPCISIIDDDTIDHQIPSSYNSSSVDVSNGGGYFSLLLPIMLSLGAKHNVKLQFGVACEGHRVGLTPYKSNSDTYSQLNVNGRAVKWLHDNFGLNVLNHSMTAQLPQTSPIVVFSVESIDSAEAATILSNGNYAGAFNFLTTRVKDLSTGKWYEVNSTKTQWVEVNKDKYAQMYYHDYPGNSGSWHFNRDFNFEYSWGEWYKRADELGLPFERMIVHNGATTTPYSIAAGRHYAVCSIRTSGTYNNPPLAAAVNRKDGDPSGYGGADYNVWDDAWHASCETVLDTMMGDKSWVIFMTHFNDLTYFRNAYVSGKTYPNGDPTYNAEWCVPLKSTEILDMINGEHDYIATPPARLGLVNGWQDWYPAPGTHVASLYDILDEALTRGIKIVAPAQGWMTHGNILNLGVDARNQEYSYNPVTPKTAEEKSFVTIGADMSIRYFNSNQ